MKRAFPLIIIAIATAVLTACEGRTGSQRPMMGQATMMSSASATTEHNSQDVTFAQMMIPHHRQAVTMSEQAATRASSPKVKGLAAQIKNAQQPEIDRMLAWLKDWGASTRPPHGMHMIEGMMSEQDMKRLETRSGKPFDRMFLQMMIKHHQGAVTMANAEEAQGVNPGAKELARSIVTSQSAEISRMRHLLKNMGPG